MTFRIVTDAPTDDFLILPSRLYDQRHRAQNYLEEKAILLGEHPLSHYFTVRTLAVYRENDIVGRVALFVYPSSSAAYFGYYECINDPEAATQLLDALVALASEYSTTKNIVGPYNASFWLGYRLKLNYFDQPPYTAEPYNKSYYKDQLIAAGFIMTDHYVSNEYRMRYDRQEVSVFQTAAARAKKQHYRIRSPSAGQFNHTMSEVHRLFMSLYSDFPGYTPITKDEFIDSFRSLKPLLSWRFVKLAYKDDAVVGFIIALPDYGSLVTYEHSWVTTARLFVRRFFARRYIVLYMGVMPEHRGLGKALARSILIEAIIRGAKLIGALAHDGKVTARYGERTIGKQYEYGLFERKL